MDNGLQLKNYNWPGGNFDRWTYNGQLTYPLSKLWRPLNFYLMVDYWNGYGETILRYDAEGSGFGIGIAVSR